MSASVLEFPTLGWVRGPYPNDTLDPVPVTPHQEAALRAWQRRAQVTVDGMLGPQSWVWLSMENEGDR